jgi:hypothetical protein
MMLRSLRNILIVSFILLIVGCQKDPVTPDLPYRKDVPVLFGTRIESYGLREIHFSLDMAVFKGDNETNAIQEFNGLPDSSFKFTDYLTTFATNNTWVNHVIEKVEYTDTVQATKFLTMFLIDQSNFPENFDSTDYNNQRFQAFNGFYRTLEGQGEVVFSSYKRNGNSHDVLKIINNQPSGSWDPQVAESLLDLTHQQGGSAGLYDGLKQAIDFMAAKTSPNKSITLFVRNKDDGQSSQDLNAIISLANLSNIKINVIWLIKSTTSVDLTALRQLPARTGGFSVYMSSIYQSSTVFLGLSKILRMDMHFYRVFVKMTIGAPNYFQTRYSTGVYLHYYTSQFFKWSWIPIYLEKPL